MFQQRPLQVLFLCIQRPKVLHNDIQSKGTIHFIHFGSFDESSVSFLFSSFYGAKSIACIQVRVVVLSAC